MKKGFTPILILVIIALIGVTGYFAYQNYQLQQSQISNPNPIPTTDPTADWKTYTSKSFSFKYPSNWQDLTNAQGGDTELGFSTANDPASVYLTISFTKLLDLSSLRKCDDTINFPCISGETTKFTLADKNAIKADIVYGITDSNFEVIQTIQSPRVQLEMNVSGGGLTNTFNQILSTFKFTDQTSSAIYTCPKEEWIDCMPKIRTMELRPEDDGRVDYSCSTEATTWYQANCPGFKGVAY